MKGKYIWNAMAQIQELTHQPSRYIFMIDSGLRVFPETPGCEHTRQPSPVYSLQADKSTLGHHQNCYKDMTLQNHQRKFRSSIISDHSWPQGKSEPEPLLCNLHVAGMLVTPVVQHSLPPSTTCRLQLFRNLSLTYHCLMYFPYLCQNLPLSLNPSLN